ncbi:MAG: hypothetical protein HC775_21730, partial [Hyellaceae cyanobacterium CSU_1_1]|nr:hypothetical protein [Hyellaceae cyanobacterium CSU_1_1]
MRSQNFGIFKIIVSVLSVLVATNVKAEEPTKIAKTVQEWVAQEEAKVGAQGLRPEEIEKVQPLVKN